MLGYLDPYLSATGFLVMPVVGLVAPEAPLSRSTPTRSPLPSRCRCATSSTRAAASHRERRLARAQRRYYAITYGSPDLGRHRRDREQPARTPLPLRRLSARHPPCETLMIRRVLEELADLPPAVPAVRALPRDPRRQPARRRALGRAGLPPDPGGASRSSSLSLVGDGSVQRASSRRLRAAPPGERPGRARTFPVSGHALDAAGLGRLLDRAGRSPRARGPRRRTGEATRLVGGCVRDALLGRPVDDIDLDDHAAAARP